MSKDKILPLSILCLSVSLIISAAILANGMKKHGENVSLGLSNISGGLNNIANTANNQNNNSLVQTRNTYNTFTAAAYLGISEDKLRRIIDNRDSGIPYIEISGDYIFSKSALDKWLETVRGEIK